MNYKKSIIGGSVAFIVATSCCWLPALIIAIGGGSTLLALSDGLEKYSGAFMVVGVGLLGIGLYQYKASKDRSVNQVAILQSTIRCPACGHQQEETMPTNACQYFYECVACKKILRPTGNDCCVYCSYGTVPCPPIQMDEACC